MPSRLSCIIFSITLTSVACAEQNSALSARPAADFTKCNFEIDDTATLGRDSTGKKNGDGYLCSIKLRDVGSLGTSKSAAIISGIGIFEKRHPTAEVFEGKGFSLDQGKKWTFQGKPTLVCDRLHFSDLSAVEDRKNDVDVTLIGRQTEHGCNQKGGLEVYRAIYVVRESPNFYASEHVVFEPNTPQSIIDQISADVIKIVESIRIRTDPAEQK